MENLGVETIIKLLIGIYDTGQIPTNLSQSIECELHRTISLMSHVTKILLRIIMKRARNKIKPKIANEQCGFVEGKGTINAIYILRTLIERALALKKDI